MFIEKASWLPGYRLLFGFFQPHWLFSVSFHSTFVSGRHVEGGEQEGTEVLLLFCLFTPFFGGLPQLRDFKNHLYSALCIQANYLPHLSPEFQPCIFKCPPDISTWICNRHLKFNMSNTETSSPLHPNPFLLWCSPAE